MSKPKPSKINAEKLIGTPVLLPKRTFTQKDCILYSLGIGFSKDPLRAQDYKYTNEFHPEFTPFPTIALTFLGGGPFHALIGSQHMPQFNPHLSLHVETKLIMIKDKIQVDVQYEHQSRIADCVDKGKNAYILQTCQTYSRNEKNQRQLCCINEANFFFKGYGGFNYDRKTKVPPPVQIPNRKPDHILTAVTDPNQAFVYRLSADLNPLHIDPKVAKQFNYERPIAHGALTYAIVVRVIVQELLQNDPTKLKVCQARFAGHVFPGETLEIYVWKEGNLLIYDTKVKERNTRTILGYLEPRESPKM